MRFTLFSRTYARLSVKDNRQIHIPVFWIPAIPAGMTGF
jgi:hypothetical protein